MKDRIFIDTNVLVYIHLFDEESQDKRKALQNLLHRRIDAELIINVQVINEFYNVLLRKNIENNVIQEKIQVAIVFEELQDNPGTPETNVHQEPLSYNNRSFLTSCQELCNIK